ncbi:MAG: hypothetical protein QG588_2256, partial [Candidatus Poribacteria bacterium]|nr:hypothetical protein [Candidatus Poribacteria bacterium]
CRNAIYNNELATLINIAYEIVEFSDQEIYKFLISCQESTLTNESIDQLIGILHERPKIMALARNPLLLTIIAYLLYNDKEFVLPYSRTEFYAHAKNVLLRQWKQERNRYKASDKQLVLQHLALFNQDRRLELKQDWLSMDRKVILKEIKKVLPDLNLLDSDAVPLLDEIVERSGLLLSIESGINYQFAHSTLQEFFVAIGLRNDAKSLVNRFKKDRPAWREIVKLWCGLDQDSTKLIQLIYEEDPITAFECLGDAHQINPALADQIINTFKSRLGETGSNGEAISRAFAIVASDPRPRGRDILTFLVNTLTNTVSDSRRTSAATSLSLTNLPKAAQVLGIYYTTHTDMRTALIQTGDLAVPILADLAKGGDVEPLNDLQAIGTPRAARALVSLLWGENKFASCQAAWRLAAILPEPNIKVILRDYPLTEDQRRAEWLTWIWEPFNEPCNSAMPIITGRVAYLMMEQVPVNLISTTTLDLRLVVPLCSIYGTRNHGFDVVEIFKLLDKISKSEGELTLTQLPKLLDGFTKDNQDPKIVEVKKKLIQIIENGDLPKKFIVNWLYMFCNLPLQLKADLSEVLINEPGITINDWQNVSYSLKYEFKTSWHYRVILFLNFIVSLIALVRATDIFWHSSTLIGWGSGFFIAIFIIISWLLLYNSDFDPKHFERSFWGRLLGKTFTPHGRNHKSLFRIIYEGFQDSFFEGLTSLFEVWLDHMGVIPMVGVGCFSTMYFVNIFPFKFLLIIWLMWLVTCVILWQSGWQSERKAKNPLYGIYGYIEKLCHESDLDI